MLNIKHLFSSLIHNFLYAENCDLAAPYQSDMQHLMDYFSTSCRAIILKKTIVSINLRQIVYTEPNIFVYDQKLQAVKKFVYFGRTVNMKLLIPLNEEASNAFGKQNGCLWSQHGISIKVYYICVVSSLLHACKT